MGVLAAIWLGASNPVAAETYPVGEEHCVVNVRANDRLNMRERPSASSPIVARKRYSECGILVTGGARGNWVPVEDGHAIGWVHRHYIAMVSPSMYCVTGVVQGDVLNMRAWPSSQSRIIHRLPRNQCNISFLPYSVGNWQKIRVAGWQGWVNRRYLSGE